jgi:hypothetical protein
MKKIFLILSTILFLNCDDDSDLEPQPQLIVKFKFDPNQARLNNNGEISVIPGGNAAQSPVMELISAHYLEFTPNATTLLGAGDVVYKAPETLAGGANAIDFQKSKIVKQNETFLKIPLSELSAGTYEYTRVSLSFQRGAISLRSNNTDYTATLASFLGYNNYITTHTIGTNDFKVNDDKLQGFWMIGLPSVNFYNSGQAPAGATTVPNPIASTSPIPAGSCVVTGKFETPLVISGNETKDITIELSLSTNKSFEWVDGNSNGKFEPALGETVVDMGFRGLIPKKL